MVNRKRRNSTESFLNQKTPSVNGLPLLENCLKAINLLSKHHFGFNKKENHFQALIVNCLRHKMFYKEEQYFLSVETTTKSLCVLF